MDISAQQVKELREKTGAGMMDCKKALVESSGDLEKAVDYLRKKGLATAQKKSGRAAAEGMVGHYIHMEGKIGVLVEVNCETDFAARSEDFRTLVKDIAMHIAAAAPRYVRREDVTPEDLEREKGIYREQAKASGKPDNIVEKIIEGKLKDFYKEVCLYDQLWVRDEEKKLTIEQLINNLIGKIGENIRVRRFVRYQTGEGLEKRSTDLKGEVEGMLGQK
jgi:elongation factor Ts